jgi:hypothetical protein
VTTTVLPVATSDKSAVGSVGAIFRDVARGGLAGLVVGIVVGGIGGRIVMRLAAIAVPGSDGRFTENGNRIGDITLAGTLGLIAFGGVFIGAVGGTLWVVVAPWIPGTGLARAVLAVPVAVALTGIGLINGFNPDFRILRHDVGVVAMLLALVALAGLSIALVDGWLESRLPPPGTSSRADATYVVLTLFGGLLILPFVVQGFVAERTPLGLLLVAVGIATLAWWWMRHRGRARMPAALVVAARIGLVVAVVLGFVELAPHVARAIGA